MRVLPGAVAVHFFVLVGELVNRFELQQIRHFTDAQLWFLKIRAR